MIVSLGFKGRGCARIHLMLTQLKDRTPLRFLAKLLAGVVAAVLALSVIGLLVIRVWLWPAVPQWQDDFLASTRAKLADRGLTLEVGSVVADWENWHRPRLTVANISLRDHQGLAVLSLEQAQATVGVTSLASLWRLTPVFSEIRLQGPQVLAGRDAAGDLLVAGFRIEMLDNATPMHPDDQKAIEWLLRQGRIRVESGRLVWSDVSRGKSAEIRELSMSLRNLGPRHAAMIKGAVSQPIGEQFLLEANFTHPLWKSPTAFAQWSGDLSVQFDRVDLAQLFEFVHLPKDAPLKINSGAGSIRAQASLSSQAVESLTVDLDLASASVQWGAKRKPLTFEQLSGRVQTTLSGARQQVKLQDLLLRSDQLSEPVTVSSAELTLEQIASTGESRVRAISKTVDLNAARWFVDHLPVAQTLKEELARLKPTGFLKDFDLALIERAQGEPSLNVATGFEAVSLSLGQDRPGFAGLSGRLKATESAGSISIDSEKAVLIFPKVFEEPQLEFDRFSVQADWALGVKTQGQESAPLKVSLVGLSASNTDLSVEAAGGYEHSGPGYGQITLKGRVLRAKPERIYRYVPLTAGSDTRSWLRTALKASPAYRADFELAGPLEQFPFSDPKSGKFFVKASVDNARLQPAPGWPLLSDIKADVIFDRERFEVIASQAKFGELPTSKISARISDLSAAQTRLQIEGALSGDLQRFLNTVNQSPIKASLGNATVGMTGKGPTGLSLSLNLNLSDSGRSAYSGKLIVGRGVLQPSANFPAITIASGAIEFDERGLTILNMQGQALGAPLTARSESRQDASKLTRVRIEGQATGRALEQWAKQAFGAPWKGELSGSTPFSVVLDVGSTVQATTTTSLRGLASTLDSPLAKPAAEEWKVRAVFRASNRETQFEIDAPKAKGQMRWHSDDKGGALLQAQFERMWLDARGDDSQTAQESSSETTAQQWPRVDLVAEDFRVGLRQWGRLEVQAHPVAATRSWDISKLSLSNPDAVVVGKGQWSTRALDPRAKARSRTVLDLELDIKNGGNFLARAGHPGVVKDTEGKIAGQLSWAGSPLDFSGKVLSGKLGINLEKGRFLKAEPGVARLVGVLNLQTLPRRIKLDFSDVFSEGFTYERIRGDLELLEGEISTQNLRIIGVQASVLLEGSASIRKETQDLRVLVLPEINAGLASLGYAALVNPAIGLGAFLAQYVLRDPVRKLLAYEYQITGKWDDPVVTPMARELRLDLPELSPSTK